MIELDDRVALRAEPRLFRLLDHYVTLGQTDREAWHDRVMEWEDGTATELTRWHGKLLASDWLEQQTGVTPHSVNRQLPACYRATIAGRRVMREVFVENN
jgi:hypothetical protein